MSNRITTALRNLISSQRGSVALQVAVGLVAIVGLAGLGAETTFLMFKQRQMQVSVDSAAVSAIVALDQVFPRDPVSEARAVSAGLGFTHGVDGATVTVNRPPATGPFAGNNLAVEVVISQTHDMSMIKLLTNSTVNVGARAVAVQQAKGRFCYLALDPTANQSMRLLNNAIMSGECGVAVNSGSETALYLDNNALIQTPTLSHGNWFLENGAAITGSPKIHHGPTVADPYADVTLPSPPVGCTGQQGSGKNNLTLNLVPGRFCSGWDFMNTVTLNLAPGTYYIDSQMKIKNNVTINGTGVSIVVNGDYPIDLKNNAFLNITAPTSGDLAGIAFFGLRNADPSVLQKFDNNVYLDIQGAIYFPNQILEVDNNGTTNPQGCTQVIGRELRFMNNVEMKNNACENTGVQALSPPAALVE